MRRPLHHPADVCPERMNQAKQREEWSLGRIGTKGIYLRIVAAPVEDDGRCFYWRRKTFQSSPAIKSETEAKSKAKIANLAAKRRLTFFLIFNAKTRGSVGSNVCSFWE